MKKMKTIILIIFCLIFTREAFSKDIEVKKFEPMAKDHTPALSSRKDIDETRWVGEVII